MASQNFTVIANAIAVGGMLFGTDTTKVLLVTSTPTESNFDTWQNRDDVTNECTGTAYTAGGIAQAYTLDALDTGNNRQSITYADITNGWLSATFSAAGAIIYKDSGSAATDILLHYVDFGGVQSIVTANFSFTYNAPFYINA